MNYSTYARINSLALEVNHNACVSRSAAMGRKSLGTEMTSRL